MLKYSTKCLTALLKVVSIFSLINVFVVYWLPINIPLNSFSAVRLTVVALIEKRYYLILVSVLISILLFLTAIAIGRNRILLPSLSLPYFMYDFAILVSLFIDGLDDGYWKVYIIQIIVSIALMVLLCIYCWNALQTKLAGQGDGLREQKRFIGRVCGSAAWLFSVQKR